MFNYDARVRRIKEFWLQADVSGLPKTAIFTVLGSVDVGFRLYLYEVKLVHKTISVLRGYFSVLSSN